MNSQRILTTGHRGYVGSALVPILLDAGHDAVGADLGWFGDGCNTASDFRNLSVEDLRGFDAIIHLAGLADDALCDAFPQDAVEVNVNQTIAFAKRAKEAGIRRFVLASSSAIYGTTDNIASEDDQPNPVSLYARTKLDAETKLLALHDDTFKIVCLRFGSGYGVSPAMRSDLVLNKLTTIAAKQGEIALATQGDCHRPFVHVRDMARALMHAAACEHVTRDHQIFNVVEPTSNTTVGAAVDLLAKAVGAKVLPAADTIDPRSYRIDPSRFIATGFKYDWTLAEGLSHLARSNRYSVACGDLDELMDRIAIARDVGQLGATAQTVPSISPARLDSKAERTFLADAALIVSTSSYRHAGGYSDRAASLVAEEFQIGLDQRVLMTRSGTDALVRALQVLGVSAGDSVVMADQSFHAVAASVLLLGAEPHYVDINADDFNLNHDAVDIALTAKPAAAVIVVDNYGTPSDWAALSKVCRRHKVPLVVDACESLGASRPEQKVVDHADLVVVSFSFTKPIHAAGMGGALIGSTALLDEVEQRPEWLYRQIRLPEINASYLVHAWPGLSGNIDRLRSTYQRYTEALTTVGFTSQAEHGRSTRIHAPFLVPADWSANRRDRLLKTLHGLGVNAHAQFPSQSALLSVPDVTEQCPVSTNVSNRVVSLPSGASLLPERVDQVIKTVTSALAEV